MSAVSVEDRRYGWLTVALLAMLGLIAATWFLQTTYIVTMPTAFAFFLSMLVLPVQRWGSNHLPWRMRWLGIPLAILVMILVLLASGAMVYLSVTVVADKWTQYAAQAQDTYTRVITWGQGRGLISPEGPDWAAINDRIVAVFGELIRSIWSFLAMLIIICILSVLMLMEVRDWKRKVRRAFSRAHHESVVDTMEVVAHKVRQYLLIRTGVSLAEASVQAVWLVVMGVDFALVWAMLFFVLSFMPYFGPIAAVFPPVLIAMVQYGFWWGVLVFAGLATIDQVMGTFWATRAQGKVLEISPAVLTLAVIYWGLVWGVAGALLAVPLTATVVIACDNIPGLQPLALLLSDTATPLELKNVPKPDNSSPPNIIDSNYANQ